MHLSLFLDENDKINTLEKVDELISAEIPNEYIYLHLYDVSRMLGIRENSMWEYLHDSSIPPSDYYK